VDIRLYVDQQLSKDDRKELRDELPNGSHNRTDFPREYQGSETTKENWNERATAEPAAM
jgi:hypothetical protein